MCVLVATSDKHTSRRNAYAYVCVCAWLRDMRHVVAYLCDIETGGRPQSDYYVVCYAHSYMVCVCICARARKRFILCLLWLSVCVCVRARSNTTDLFVVYGVRPGARHECAAGPGSAAPSQKTNKPEQ